MGNLPAEHPASQHRNLVGMQRMAMLASMNQEAIELYNEGYSFDADRVLDMITELTAVWDNERV